MFDLALYQPEIPPNTGNLIRLAANTGCRLHLIEPLGFRLNDRALARAGLDYRALAQVAVHAGWDAFRAGVVGQRVFAFTTRGARCYADVRYEERDVLLFGPETRGLPEHVLTGVPPDRRVRLPMRPGSRSLNLANAAAVAVYEAWRQRGFKGGEPP